MCLDSNFRTEHLIDMKLNGKGMMGKLREWRVNWRAGFRIGNNCTHLNELGLLCDADGMNHCVSTKKMLFTTHALYHLRQMRSGNTFRIIALKGSLYDITLQMGTLHNKKRSILPCPCCRLYWTHCQDKKPFSSSISALEAFPSVCQSFLRCLPADAGGEQDLFMP